MQAQTMDGFYEAWYVHHRPSAIRPEPMGLQVVLAAQENGSLPILDPDML